MEIPSTQRTPSLTEEAPITSVVDTPPLDNSRYESSLTGNNQGSFFGKIKNAISSIKGRIKNFFDYLLSFFKAASTVKETGNELQVKLDRVDLLSEELALAEADESQNLIVYHMLGKQIYENSHNPIWKFYVSAVPGIGKRSSTDIGKKEAKEDFKLLLPHLKAYYGSEIARLKIKNN